MREIKFRVWVKKSKELLPAQGIIFPRGTEDEKVILMQYTGLTDKNGKEIYEGDIIKHKNLKLQVIEYGYAGFEPFCDNLGDEYSSNDANSEHYTVIGNIYENSELLKEVS